MLCTFLASLSLRESRSYFQRHSPLPSFRPSFAHRFSSDELADILQTVPAYGSAGQISTLVGLPLLPLSATTDLRTITPLSGYSRS